MDATAGPEPTKRKRAGASSKPIQAGAEKTEENEVRTTPVIVGLGASAGGLEAFQAFFTAVPANSGLAFVVVAHLDPNRDSILADLLQKSTPMPVHQVVDGEKTEPDHVYVTAPGHEVAILNGVLHLMDLPTPATRLPIDAFFRSLAQDQGANAVGVILSGTGTDGTLGIRALKEKSGLIVVQDEDSAKYDGMPRSAVATGVADYILPPAEMPAQVLKYIAAAGRGTTAPAAVPTRPFLSALQKIVVLLRANTGHDFSQYRKNTICRRVERRMNIHQIHDIADYVRFLQQSDRETSILFKELLIGVTSFFRDPDAFSGLKEKALLDLVRGKRDDCTVRVWVPGCSTGEEAYSISMLLHETMRDVNRTLSIQVFGTDIDADAIEVARAGVYPANIASDVHPDLLKRYFTRADDGSYRIRRAVRDTLVFAPQNILSDPPFTKLDLLSCRNMLIYFEPELQKKLFPVFHYALNPGGILFLGSSETVGEAIGLFAAVDHKWKIFQRTSAAVARRHALHFPVITARQSPGLDDARTATSHEPFDQARPLAAVEAILNHSDLPPCAIIDHALNIIYLHGRTGKFLEPSVGTPTFNVIEMARPGLRNALTDAISGVGTHMQETVRRGVRIAHNGGHVLVDLTVRPVLGGRASAGLMMVVFEETVKAVTVKAKSTKRVKGRPTGEGVEELESELRQTKETLQATIEELQTANEEFKSTNEELQSTNEELQSTNEELETSKEELQSLNEEATTANTELQSRLEELGKANDDMTNLLDSTDIALLFLDTDLNVRRFTPQISDLIPLTAADAGRPIRHFASSLVDVDLASCAGEVLETLNTEERDVRSNDGRWFVMRMRPYRTTGNVIDGVAVVFQDVSLLKRAVRAADEARALAESVVDAVREPLLVLDPELRVVSANRAFFHAFRVREDATLGCPLFELGNGQWNIPTLRQLLSEILPGSKTVVGFRVEHDFPEIGMRRMLLNARCLGDGPESTGAVVLAIEDVTDK